ncbi:MAG: DUF484 family protein [Betaproteobacteria bacterium]|nr:DUF484 family protein [Betaproteobacteria bacterium]MBU6512016.1 DUF484 family protein [Betaproteobacteria bacterium]MDE1955980.1 DUF484 family protein [Betaproteobacteria bacterium]
MELSEQDLAAYLAEHPDFFERHAELLATVQLASPHGNRAVSLQERQIEMLRDKMRALEHRLAEMMRNAADNEALSARLLGWARALLEQTDAAALPRSAVEQLRQRFDMPLAALRLWGLSPEFSALAEAAPVGEDIPVLASSLSQPFCGANAGFEAARWLDAPPQSLALVALRADPQSAAFGLLVLGSQQSDRFTADMGTEFLARLGEVASSALLRLLPRA